MTPGTGPAEPAVLVGALGVLGAAVVLEPGGVVLDGAVVEDEVMIAVMLKEGATLDYAEFIHHCAAQMPYFAVPRYIDIREDLPRTENGKIQKFKLREEGVTDTTWDREAAGISVKR